MSREEPRVDFYEANKLASEVVNKRLRFDDAAHRLYQYWETRLTTRQAEHKLRRCVDTMQAQNARRADRTERRQEP
jgi:hypothetical protein